MPPPPPPPQACTMKYTYLLRLLVILNLFMFCLFSGYDASRHPDNIFYVSLLSLNLILKKKKKFYFKRSKFKEKDDHFFVPFFCLKN